MIEKDVEYSIKNCLLGSNEEAITITNELKSDGIVRNNGTAVGILEFKLKRNFQNEDTAAKVVCQALCYYYNLVAKEKIDYTKPFYILAGDENEIMVFNIHKLPSQWLLEPAWKEAVPSRAASNETLFKLTKSMIEVIKPVYYHYETVNELAFGLKIIFSSVLL